MITEPTLLAFATVSDLADRIGTSRPSIVRFANKLGFDGYASLQAVGRRRVEDALTRPRDRIRRDLSDRPTELDKLAAGVETAAGIAARGEIWAIAERVAAAGSVWIVSGENSLAGAYALRSGLSMIRPRVHLVDGHSVGRDLIDADQDDLGIAIDFYRYRRSSVAVTRTWAEHGIPIVAITDSPLSPLAAAAEVLCILSVPAVGPFDSSVPAVVVGRTGRRRGRSDQPGRSAGPHRPARGALGRDGDVPARRLVSIGLFNPILGTSVVHRYAFEAQRSNPSIGDVPQQRQRIR